MKERNSTNDEELHLCAEKIPMSTTNVWFGVDKYQIISDLLIWQIDVRTTSFANSNTARHTDNITYIVHLRCRISSKIFIVSFPSFRSSSPRYPVRWFSCLRWSKRQNSRIKGWSRRQRLGSCERRLTKSPRTVRICFLSCAKPQWDPLHLTWCYPEIAHWCIRSTVHKHRLYSLRLYLWGIDPKPYRRSAVSSIVQLQISSELHW